MKTLTRYFSFLALVVACEASRGSEQIIDQRLHHLRVGQREWSDFPAQAEGPRLVLRFQAERNEGEWALRLRQQDVKQTWNLLLNGKELGRLRADENDMVVFFPIAAGRLVTGENTLQVEQVGTTPDDVRVGDVRLDHRSVKEVLGEGEVEVLVRDAGQAGTRLLPCKITILDAQGSLMTVAAGSSQRLAVRPGVIYTGTGQARFTLPAGDYTVHATRGFEYGVGSSRFTSSPALWFARSWQLAVRCQRRAM
jgi:hypothetical protein